MHFHKGNIVNMPFFKLTESYTLILRTVEGLRILYGDVLYNTK